MMDILLEAVLVTSLSLLAGFAVAQIHYLMRR